MFRTGRYNVLYNCSTMINKFKMGFDLNLLELYLILLPYLSLDVKIRGYILFYIVAIMFLRKLNFTTFSHFYSYIVTNKHFYYYRVIIQILYSYYYIITYTQIIFIAYFLDCVRWTVGRGREDIMGNMILNYSITFLVGIILTYCVTIYFLWKGSKMYLCFVLYFGLRLTFILDYSIYTLILYIVCFIVYLSKLKLMIFNQYLFHHCILLLFFNIQYCLSLYLISFMTIKEFLKYSLSLHFKMVDFNNFIIQ